MNKVILMGRLTNEPDVRYSGEDNSLATARYTLAVDRRVKKTQSNAQTADFISCVAFGPNAKFAEQYLHKGTKIVVDGRIQTGKYTNKNGQVVYTTDVVVEAQEFAESKGAAETATTQAKPKQASRSGVGTYTPPNPYENIPVGVNEELPFN